MADHSRTEKATPRRRQRALEQGNVLRSREASSALVFGGAFLLFAFLGPTILRQSQNAFYDVLSYVLTHRWAEADVNGFFWVCSLSVLRLAGPVVGLTFALAVVGPVMQHGLRWTFAPLTPNFAKFNPVANLSKIFSRQGLSEFVKSTLIFVLISYLAWSVVRSELGMIPSLVLLPVPQIALLFGRIVYRIALRVVIFMVFLALADYLFQKYRYEESLKMTKQEVKEEVKESEGNPMVKGKIRRAGRNLLRRRMMHEVPKADAVITNPTEYAVAIRYNMEKMAAPQVVAKGRGYVAAKIRALAVAHKIPIVENPPLARALYKTVEVGQQIPAEFYKAIAEILAYLYRLKAMRL